MAKFYRSRTEKRLIEKNQELTKKNRELQHKLLLAVNRIGELKTNYKWLCERFDKLKRTKHLELMGNVNSAGYRVLGREGG